MKQPTLGLAASLLVVAVSLCFISLFPTAKFLGSITYCLVCLVPMEIVIGITWGCKQPGFAASRRQPVKGLLLVLLNVMVAMLVAAAYFFLFGGIRPLAPMLIQCIIVSVIITFWAAIIWGGWPLTSLIKNPVAAGLTMLAVCYVVNYILFRIFFNYEFMQPAPVYVASLDPHGLYNANFALVFSLTALAVMFLVLHFDLWPLTASPSLMRQPVLGLVWTLICLILGGIVFHIGIVTMSMDPLTFMITVPIPFIFGTIIVLNMLQNSLFARQAQPWKGILNALAAAVIGTALAFLYTELAPMVSGRLTSGAAAGNEFERWLASALLGVTFPLLIFYAEFFQFWPFHNLERNKD